MAAETTFNTVLDTTLDAHAAPEQSFGLVAGRYVLQQLLGTGGSGSV